MLNNKRRFEQWMPALFDGQFHWDFILPAFKPTNIKPMDFDCVVERNGHVLIIETKDDGKEIDLGQRITLTNEWRRGSTVIHVRGKSNAAISGFAVYHEGTYKTDVDVGSRALSDCNAFDVIYCIRKWFCWASGLPVPSREAWDNELFVWDMERIEAKGEDLLSFAARAIAPKPG